MTARPDDAPARQRRGHRWRSLVLVAALASLVGGSLLPWVASGERLRNSYELVRAGRTLGVFDGGLERRAAQAWYLLPLVAALALLALALDRRRLAAALAAVAAVAGAAMALAVRATSLPTRPGVGVTMGAAGLAIGGAALAAQRDRPSRRRARQRDERDDQRDDDRDKEQ